MPKKSTTLPLDPADIQDGPVAAPTGSLATPRENLHAMEPLSRKHYLDVKGPRADAPDVRAYPSVYAKVTP